MWATWADIQDRDYIGQDRANIGQDVGYLGRHYAKMWATWANLGPRQGQTCAQIRPTSANNNTTTTTTTTPARAAGSAFAGARLSGVSLINPGAGPAPVSLPEAFGGNRRLYTAAPPAADPPRTYLVSIPVHDYRCNLQCILRVVFKKHRFLQGFVAFAVSRFHLGDVKKPWVFHLGRGPERKIWRLDGLGVNIGPTSAKMWATWVNIRLR